jgi:hypothetical protein
MGVAGAACVPRSNPYAGCGDTRPADGITLNNDPVPDTVGSIC